MSQSIPLPPELFPLVAAYLPLRSAPRTLLSLALGNHRLCSIVRSIMYSRLVLKNANDATTVFEKILDEPQLGMAVTEIHLMVKCLADDATSADSQSLDPFAVITTLHHVIVDRKLVPRLLALGIYLEGSMSSIYQSSPETDKVLDHNFWTTLSAQHPLLQSLSLRNLGYGQNGDAWRRSSGEIIPNKPQQGLSTLRLELRRTPVGQHFNLHAVIPIDLSCVIQLAETLHTLSLNSRPDILEPLMSAHFPNLKWLRLSTSKAHATPLFMDFLRLHSQLESLSLTHYEQNWLYRDVEPGFLPHLKHLKATCQDIIHLRPTLPQLVSLSVTKNYNCQVPYLLRVAIPNGLPRLKSLEIEYTIFDLDIEELEESALWYETADGSARIQWGLKAFDLSDLNYVQSIADGAPNLEELAFHNVTLTSDVMVKISPTLGQFIELKRFYCCWYSQVSRYSTQYPKTLPERFLRDAQQLARKCGVLEQVTVRGNLYMSGIIERNSAGEVKGVKLTDGIGMEVPAQDDEPFLYDPNAYRKVSPPKYGNMFEKNFDHY